MKRATLTVLLLALAACKPGAGSSAGGSAATSKYPGTEEGAKQLLTDIRAQGADAKAMTMALKPSADDYKAVFEADVADKMQKTYEGLWSDVKTVIGADPANTELLLSKATSDDIKAWTDQAKNDFPGGYQRVGPHLKPGFTFYRWKYAKPGETLGMAYDGLVYVNGHWAWFPKPWRALGE